MGRWNYESTENDLAAAIRERAEGDVLRLNIKGSSRYVQIRVGPEGTIRAEVPDNGALEQSDLLNEAQLAALRSRGWKSARIEGTESYVLVASERQAGKEIGRSVLETLTEVLELESPFHLGYEAHDGHGRALSIPTLRLPELSRSSPGWFPSDPVVVARWDFLYDNISEEFGGGFATGEFVLLADGRLFRTGSSSRSQGRQGQAGVKWRGGDWILVEEWPPSSDAEAAARFLTTDGYDLTP